MGSSWKDQDEIRPRQSVWYEHKNGIIDGINYEDRLVFVDFYEKGRQTFTFDDFLGSWDDKLQQWIIVTI